MSSIFYFMTAARAQNPFHQYAKLLQNSPSSISPEQAHRFRTTARRLQAFSERMDLSKRESNAISDTDTLRKRASKLHDIDIQIALLAQVHTPNLKAPIESLQGYLQKKRTRFEAKLNKRIQRFQKEDLGKVLASISKRVPKGAAHSGIMAEVHTEFARLVSDHITHPRLKLDEELLHDLRIRLKKLRYRAEAAGPLPKAVAMVASIKKVQDAIGHWHDCLKLLSTASKHIQDSTGVPLHAQIRSLTASAHSDALHACYAMAAEYNAPKKSPRTVVQPISSHTQTA